MSQSLTPEQAKSQPTHSDSAETDLMAPDAIVEILRATPFSVLPEEALRAAQQQPDAMKPLLLELVRESILRVREGRPIESNASYFALYLLTESKAREVLPLLIELISLPGKGPFDVLGNGVHEDVPRMLATFTDDDLSILHRLVRNRKLNEYVRAAASTAYIHLVRDEKLTREQAASHLEGHLRWVCDHEQGEDEVAGWLICDLELLAVPSSLEIIERAFAMDRVHDSITTLKYVRKMFAKGDEHYAKSMEATLPGHISDTIAELKEWSAFREDSDSDTEFWEEDAYSALDDQSLDTDAEAPVDWSDWDVGTIRNETPRVGRNQTCPCGSGKKYKKCCGRH